MRRNKRDPWNLLNLVLLVLMLMTGFLLVWLNIERLDLAYRIENLGSRLEASEDLQAKLEVERDNLVSSYRLNRHAEQAGLEPAVPGQVIILEKPEPEK
ncbi:MAG: hypothetical protein ACOC0U_00315 [Desulfovibrionales bacterium]